MDHLLDPPVPVARARWARGALKQVDPHARVDHHLDPLARVSVLDPERLLVVPPLDRIAVAPLAGVAGLVGHSARPRVGVGAMSRSSSQPR